MRDLQLQVSSLESIFRRYSHRKGLVYDKIEQDNCTFVSLGQPAPVTESLRSARNNSCTQIPQLRHLVGEASYIVTILTPDQAQLIFFVVTCQFFAADPQELSDHYTCGSIPGI